MPLPILIPAISGGAISPMTTIIATPIVGAILAGALTATSEIIKCKTGKVRCDGKGQNKPGQTTSRLAKRQAVGPCNVPQYNFDMCRNDLQTIVVQTSIPEPGVARFDNIPAACMTLSTVLTGACGIEPPYPIVCGSACLQYAGLSTEQMEMLSNALAPYAAD